MFLIMAVATGTEIELPTCLNFWLSGKSGNWNDSSKPWKDRHSFGVNFRMPKLSLMRGTLCPPVPILAVSVGQSLFLFSRT